jgi:glycosyltransferase involved in cell wall biosynthesis
MRKILGVDYIAPLKVQSGMGTSSRSYYRALTSLDDLLVNPIPYNHGFEHHAKVRFYEKTKKGIDLNPVAKALILHQNADGFFMMRERYAKELASPYSKKIAAWVWELSKFQTQWKKEADLLDEIWVPSEFVRKSVSEIVEKPVISVPYPVTISEISRTSFCKNPLGSSQFLFGYFFDASSFVERKNPLALLKAFQQVRKKYQYSRLILKIAHFQRFEEYLKEFSISSSLMGGVTIIEQNLLPKHLYGLMNELDCYVSTHRSEGFGLTVAEALLLGKPVIASDYGSTQDFVSNQTAYPIPVELTAIKQDMGPYQKGLVWAEIDQLELTNAMLSVIENQDLALAKSNYAMKFMRANYSFKAIGELMESRLTK